MLVLEFMEVILQLLQLHFHLSETPVPLETGIQTVACVQGMLSCSFCGACEAAQGGQV